MFSGSLQAEEHTNVASIENNISLPDFILIYFYQSGFSDTIGTDDPDAAAGGEFKGKIT